MSFFAIPTLAGQEALVAAAAGTAPLALRSIVVGDGGGSATTPLETATSLVNQRASFTITSMVRDGTKVTVDTVLDENTGGWAIREAGIVDEDGNLLYIASVPETYKGTIAQGVNDVLTLGLVLVVTETAEITLITDGSDYATKAWVADNFEKKPAPFLFWGTM